MRILQGVDRVGGLRIGLVVSRYHGFVTERLERGAIEALKAAGAADDRLAVLRVPGAFEIPQAARRAADSGAFDALVCLGCLIRGATPHFDYIASAVAHGLTDVASATGVPVAFGVLTTNSAEEALERAGDGPSNKGWEAAQAAVEMATLFAQIRRTPAPPGISV
jgi:6,7-dimethyl-8-ribityllumazine synthase